MLIADDNVPIGELEGHHLFRKKKYKHMYYCPKCIRNFETVNAVDSCIFCSSEIKELTPVTADAVKIEKHYRYYCPTCEKNFIEPERVTVCSNCGNKFIHVYEWQEAGKGDFFMRRFLLLRAMVLRFMDKLVTIRKKRVKQTVIDEKENKPEHKYASYMPVASPRRPLIRLSDSEELPSR